MFVCLLATNNECILERSPHELQRGHAITFVFEFTQHFSIQWSIQRVVFGIWAGIEMFHKRSHVVIQVVGLYAVTKTVGVCVTPVNSSVTITLLLLLVAKCSTTGVYKMCTSYVT